MYQNYKIVCVTPAGRRRYMQYLIPQILSDDIVDRYDIWLNTMNMEDIVFFQKVAERYNKIRLVYQPERKIAGNRSINAFWGLCNDKDSIYIRLDDDIVWLEPDFFQKLIQFRIENPSYFMIAPLVINNALSTYIMENTAKIVLDKYYNASCMHPILWKSGEFAYQLHDWFIEKFLKSGKYKDLHCGIRPIAMNRYSINSLCWFGTQIEQIGNVSGDEEEYISVKRPTELGLCNCIYGDVIAAHFAFYTQRKILDKRNILERYGTILQNIWEKNKILNEINKNIQSVMKYVKENKTKINEMESPYEQTFVKKSIKNTIMPFIPSIFLTLRKEYMISHSNINYIK